MVQTMSDDAIPYRYGIFFVPVFIALYLMIGGMKGAAWVNTVQGVFFTLMVFVLFYAVMAKNGGFGPTMDMVFEKHPELFQLGAKGGKVWGYTMAFGFAAAMCLGCVCFPQPYMHAYSSRSVKGFKVMILVFGAICVVVIAMTTMIGIASRVLVPGLAGGKVGGVYGEAARVALPDALAALAVAGGFTAAMTTVNSMVFGNASNMANDLYKLLKPDADTKALVRFARVCVAVLMIVCVLIALDSETPVAELSVIAFGIGAVTIFPLWGAYFWKRATRYGAIAGTLAGLGSNLVFMLLGVLSGQPKGVMKTVLFPQGALYGLNGFLVSFIIAGVVFFVVSLLTKPGATEKKSLALFFHPSLES
jgi:SSS family solute:Na+ symporter